MPRTIATTTLAAPLRDFTTDAEIAAAWESGAMTWEDDTLVFHGACACSATSYCLAHL